MFSLSDCTDIVHFRDVGGQKKIRALWHHYYEGTDAIIFVIDSNDPGRIDEAKEELYGMMQHEYLRHSSLLVYANKQDLPNSLSVAQIVDKLELSSRLRGNQWHVQGAVAVTGDGLYEGLEWLSATLNAKS
jgi:ADP-ribosylation factor 1/2